ncbi:MAG TPA: FAD-dependent oxidoreductase [Gemmatimonadota bacterium]|nr:FAD-dependent oxidoreductase [Gemmatimonadota bacterium]
MPVPTDRAETRFPDHRPPLTQAQARAEAGRCLFCHDAPCVHACPTAIDIPLFIKQIHDRNELGAARTILEANAFGYSCARVCPVEVLCVGACVYNAKGEPPIMIGRLQRFATDPVIEGGVPIFAPGEPTGRAVACVGGGPASIACAHELVRLGHRAVILEARSYRGGLNTDGVAPYKMKADASLAEVDWLTAIGIEWRDGVVVGKDVTWKTLEAEFDAIFLGLGLGSDTPLGLPGENLEGVWGATRLIAAIKTGREAPPDPDRVRAAVVIGGGNTAIDAARELAGLGVSDVRIVYRRSADRMTAYRHEREHAIQEGVRFEHSVQPLAFEGNGRLEAVRLTAVDDRLRPVGEPFRLPADLVALAIGQARLEELLGGIPGLAFEDGRIVVDPITGRTSNPRYWAGGDLANGGAEVVNAAAEGKRAAHGIDARLREESVEKIGGGR